MLQNQKNKDYQIYLLQCSDNTYYTGITNDFPKRLNSHVHGKASKYTKGRRPVKVIAISGFMTKSDALRFERLIKQLPKSRKQKAVRNAGFWLSFYSWDFAKNLLEDRHDKEDN